MSVPVLFAAVVLIWGTTWYAILFQLQAAAPEVAVAIRFALAAALVLGLCALRGIPLRFPARLHGLFALQGILGFCLSYVAVYYAEQYVVSGLVAVGYATTPLLNLVLARLLYGTPMSRRVALGGLLGLAGVVLVFGPQFGQAMAAADGLARPALGATFTAAGVLGSAAALMVVLRIQQQGVRGWAPLGWSMAWSVPATLALALVLQRPFTVAWSPAFGGSLLYLAVAGSALAFAGYYRIVERAGAARAGYVGVMVPVVALVVSSLLEGYAWTPASIVGVLLAVVGNVLTLATGSRSTPQAAAASPDGAGTPAGVSPNAPGR